MSQAPAMPVFTDALIGDTTHLTIEEFGAYMMLLFVTWRNNGKPLPDDAKRLARICRVTEARWCRRLRPVLVSFFDISDGSWRQKRLEKEWKYLANIREKNSHAGRASALKRKETHPTGVAATLQPNGNPHTHTQYKIDSDESISPLSPPVGGVIDLEAKHVRRQSDPKGTRLEADWQPTAGDCAFADSYGFRPGDVAEEFRDYWLAKPGPNARKVDWSRTFHAWVRRKAEQPGGFHAGSGSRGNGSGGHGVVAALNRIHIKRRAEGMD